MNSPLSRTLSRLTSLARVRTLSRRAWPAAIIAGAFVVAGCDTPAEPTTAPAATAGRSTGRIVAEADDPCAYTFGQQTPPAAAGGNFTVSLTSVCLWTATSDQLWLTTSSRSSAWSGTDQVAYSVAANATT